MGKPLVTVAIPTYRRPELLREALESVRAQTFRDFAVLVSDNASGDGTGAVVREFSDLQIEHYRHETNLGAKRNFRFALTHPQTPFVAQLEDDNLWLPHHLENAMAGFKIWPEASMYGCGTEGFGGNTQNYWTPWWLEGTREASFSSPRERMVSILRKTPIASSSWVMRRAATEAIEEWGGPFWPACFDALWEGQQFMAGGLIYEPRLGVKYRWHETNYTHGWKKDIRMAAAEIRWTMRVLASMGLRRGLLDPDAMVREVVTWPAREASTFVTALAVREAPTPLRTAALRIFQEHPEVQSGGVSGHTRLAGMIGSWYLGYADRIDRWRACWPPAGLPSYEPH